MKHYAKTEGYVWTDGDGNYYAELYAPDNAPEYSLVPEIEIVEPDDVGYAEAGKILMGVME